MYHCRMAGGWDSGSRQSATSLSPSKYLEFTPEMKGAAWGRSEISVVVTAQSMLADLADSWPTYQQLVAR